MPPNTKRSTSPTAETTARKYNRPEAEAIRLGISRRQLTNWMKRGMIPFIRRERTILFDAAKVDTALAKFETQEVTR